MYNEITSPIGVIVANVLRERVQAHRRVPIQPHARFNDTAGPFRTKGSGGYRYLLVGSYRHPLLKGDEKKPLGDPREVKPPPDDGCDWILEEEEGDAVDDGAGVGEADLGDLGGEGEDAPEDKEIESLKELAEPVEFVSIYLARSLRTRKRRSSEVHPGDVYDS